MHFQKILKNVNQKFSEPKMTSSISCFLSPKIKDITFIMIFTVFLNCLRMVSENIPHVPRTHSTTHKSKNTHKRQYSMKCAQCKTLQWPENTTMFSLAKQQEKYHLTWLSSTSSLSSSSCYVGIHCSNTYNNHNLIANCTMVQHVRSQSGQLEF